jgi:hypothetical protein
VIEDINFKFVITFIGFKAHTVHMKCLERFNDTLIMAFNDTGVFPEIPDDGFLVWTNSEGEFFNKTLPRCNLEEELDNVRI